MTSVSLKDPAVKRSLKQEQAALEDLYNLAELLADRRKIPIQEALEELRKLNPVARVVLLIEHLCARERTELLKRIVEYNRKNGPKFEAGDPRKWSHT